MLVLLVVMIVVASVMRVVSGDVDRLGMKYWHVCYKVAVTTCATALSETRRHQPGHLKVRSQF